MIDEPAFANQRAPVQIVKRTSIQPIKSILSTIEDQSITKSLVDHLQSNIAVRNIKAAVAWNGKAFIPPALQQIRGVFIESGNNPRVIGKLVNIQRFPGDKITWFLADLLAAQFGRLCICAYDTKVQSLFQNKISSIFTDIIRNLQIQ